MKFLNLFLCFLIAYTPCYGVTGTLGQKSVNSIVQYTLNSPDKAGVIQAYAGSTAPVGWMKAEGQVLEKATYPELFANIGSTWDTFNHPVDGLPTVGGTQFAIPNLKGLYLGGVGNSGVNRTLATFQSDSTAKNGLALSGNVAGGTASLTGAISNGAPAITGAVAGGTASLTGAVAGGTAGNGTLGVSHTAATNGTLGVLHTAATNGTLGVSHTAATNGTLGVSHTAATNGNLGVSHTAATNGNLGVSHSVTGTFARSTHVHDTSTMVAGVVPIGTTVYLATKDYGSAINYDYSFGVASGGAGLSNFGVDVFGSTDGPTGASSSVSNGTPAITGAITGGGASLTGNVAGGTAALTGAIAGGSASLTGAIAGGSASLTGAIANTAANNGDLAINVGDTETAPDHIIVNTFVKVN